MNGIHMNRGVLQSLCKADLMLAKREPWSSGWSPESKPDGRPEQGWTRSFL